MFGFSPPWNWWMLAIFLILGGILAASSMIVRKKPDVEKAIKTLAHYQGWIGLILLFFGIWNFLFEWLFHLGSYFRYFLKIFPLTGIIFMVGFLLAIVLGIFLAMNLLKTRKELPKEKLEEIEKKITPKQVPLGVAAIFSGLYLFLWGIIIWKF
jgi:hypothetical protein